MAAVGAAGGTVLAGAAAAPAAAAGADRRAAPGLTPVVVHLTEASTIAVNAAHGNDFRVTLSASCGMGNPSHSLDGEKIIFQITQGAGGPFTVTWGSAYSFSEDIPQPTLSTTAGSTDLLGFIYNAAKAKWLLAAFVRGFS